jgi:hypothetical protein
MSTRQEQITRDTLANRTHRPLKTYTAAPTIGARKYRFPAVAGAAMVVTLYVLSYPLNLGPGRPPTESETVFSYFAENLGEAQLCDKISWAAFQRYSTLFAGGGSSFARSDCYESVAIRRHAPTVCWRVRPLVDVNPISAGYSALSCRRRVAQGGRSYVSLATGTLIRAFEALGYDPDQLHLEGVIEPAIRPADVYRSLERESGVVDTVQRALDQPHATLQSNDKNYLTHLAAVATGDARWCDRIPERQAVATEPMPFRDWCYLTLAFNTRDVRVCERMTPAASEAKVIEAKAAGVRPDIADQLSAHAQCARIDKWIGPRLRYGPEVPQDPLQTERLIAALGHEMPRARDWPPDQIAAYYSRFLDALQVDAPVDPRRAAARAKLIGRITARAELP